MSEEKPTTLDEAKPEEFVLPAGEITPIFAPPDADLLFTRDHSFKGLVYEASIEHWFRNGSHNGGPVIETITPDKTTNSK